MEFSIDNFTPSDGIGECEAIIKSLGGICKKGMIALPINKEHCKSEILNAAVDYLVNEWDYSI